MKHREFRSHILSTIRGDIDDYLVHFQLELSSEIWSFETQEFRFRVCSTLKDQDQTHTFPSPFDLRDAPPFPGCARGLRAWLRLPFPWLRPGMQRREEREIGWRVGGRSEKSRAFGRRRYREEKVLRSERKRWGG